MTMEAVVTLEELLVSMDDENIGECCISDLLCFTWIGEDVNDIRWVVSEIDKTSYSFPFV
jgi:hypothetical protein